LDNEKEKINRENELNKKAVTEKDIELKVVKEKLEKTSKELLEEKSKYEIKELEKDKMIEEKIKLIQEEKKILENDILRLTNNVSDLTKEKENLEEELKKLSTKKDGLEENLEKLKNENEDLTCKMSSCETKQKSLESEISYINSQKEIEINKLADLEFQFNQIKVEYEKLEKEKLILNAEKHELLKNNNELIIAKNDLGSKLKFSERLNELNKKSKEINKTTFDQNLEFSYSFPINTPTCSTVKKPSGLTLAEEFLINEDKPIKIEIKYELRDELANTEEEKRKDEDLKDRKKATTIVKTSEGGPSPISYAPYNPFPKTNNNVSPFHGKENERIEDWLYIVELVLEGNGVVQDRQKIIFASSYLRLHE
ncbi:unnamed protein product, partial [Brachionus calyciflorus]